VHPRLEDSAHRCLPTSRPVFLLISGQLIMEKDGQRSQASNYQNVAHSGYVIHRVAMYERHSAAFVHFSTSHFVSKCCGKDANVVTRTGHMLC
jgi:hypothetical protein